MQQTLRTQWQEIYGSEHEASLEQLLTLLEQKRTLFAERPADHTPDWYRDAVVYSLYVDAYAGDFTGLTNKLDYLAELGVNTLWLLPILDSPMRDQGFDIRDFRAVRDDLGGNSAFTRFIAAAHQKGIRLLFDMAVNHSSDQHPWFESARASKDSPYRDFYIWSDDTSRYSDARLIFKGMVPSNWEFNEATGDYFFHRFYAFQPDLNYRNPALLIAMIENFLFWKEQGVDGLRMDAIPFIWKEEGTNCEDLPTTHTILKLIRSALDYCQPGTLLIAEANMAPKQVVSYFGKDDECQAAYHFPLMPMFYIALAESTYHPIQQALSADVTPAIPDKSRWMSFLRCHDELTLEFVTPAVRAKMNQYFLHDPQCTFREGEGISGRLFPMLQDNPAKLLVMNSMLLTTEGSPILYFGDEVGMGNDYAFFEESSARTGFRDTRFLNRGNMDWAKVERAHSDPDSHESLLFNGLKAMIHARQAHADCFHGPARFLNNDDPAVYGLARQGEQTHLEVYHNLSDVTKTVQLEAPMHDLLTGSNVGHQITLAPYAYCWLKY